MKQKCIFIFFLLILYPTAQAHASDGICACYYDPLGYCEYFFVDDLGVSFTDSSECVIYCDDTFGSEVIDTDFDADSDSATGISVGADCTDSDEAAVTTAAATASTSSSTTSKATNTNS